MGRLAAAHAAAGDRPKGVAVLRELEARARRGCVSPYQIAIAQLGLGDTALTLNLFDPLWDPIRADPRSAACERDWGCHRECIPHPAAELLKLH